jgi:four helix bundle protein
MTWPTQRRRWSEQQAPNPKLQAPNNIQTEPIKKPAVQENSKPRDLEDRTFLFAESVRALVKKLPRTIGNIEDVRQLVRASGSVAANWIEADEALSKKDFILRVKICRKEAKESRLFRRLVESGIENATRREALAAEARELTLIFASIISKSSGS